MNTLQLVFAIAGFSLISCSSLEGIESRQYLPAAVPVAQRKLFLYPFYNQYQPLHTSSYKPQYHHGLIAGYHQQQALGTSLGGYQQQGLGQQITTGTTLGGYQQQGLGQQITTGTTLGGYQQQALGQQITAGATLGGYQKPILATQTSLDLVDLGLIGIYPNLNVVASLKPNVNGLETDTISGNYVYGKNK